MSNIDKSLSVNEAVMKRLGTGSSPIKEFMNILTGERKSNICIPFDVLVHVSSMLRFLLISRTKYSMRYVLSSSQEIFYVLR